jgi:hypothetical protein
MRYSLGQGVKSDFVISIMEKLGGQEMKIPHAMPCVRELLNPKVQVDVRMTGFANPVTEARQHRSD